MAASHRSGAQQLLQGAQACLVHLLAQAAYAWLSITGTLQVMASASRGLLLLLLSMHDIGCHAMQSIYLARR